MSENLFELGISLVVGLLSMVIVVWIVVSGQIAYMDGIAFALIAFTIGVFFLFNVYLSYRAGEMQALLKPRKDKTASSGDSARSA